jgi:hypothetical protein
MRETQGDSGVDFVMYFRDDGCPGVGTFSLGRVAARGEDLFVPLIGPHPRAMSGRVSTSAGTVCGKGCAQAPSRILCVTRVQGVARNGSPRNHGFHLLLGQE